MSFTVSTAAFHVSTGLTLCSKFEGAGPRPGDHVGQILADKLQRPLSDKEQTADTSHLALLHKTFRWFHCPEFHQCHACDGNNHALSGASPEDRIGY